MNFVKQILASLRDPNVFAILVSGLDCIRPCHSERSRTAKHHRAKRRWNLGRSIFCITKTFGAPALSQVRQESFLFFRIKIFPIRSQIAYSRPKCHNERKRYRYPRQRKNIISPHNGTAYYCFGDEFCDPLNHGL